MGIAPVTEFRVQSKILVADIEASDISHTAVNDTELAVVTVVDPEVHRPQQRREKHLHLAPGLAQLAEEPGGNPLRADLVVEQPHFDAFPRLCRQLIP
ncbi:hypothetical protein D3C75_1200860 [compost metagenome]